jgi:alpha-mannosidase
LRTNGGEEHMNSATTVSIKEILVLHHSHLDMGYTHAQPVLKAMQVDYIDLALDFLEQTASWPEPSRPKWTCEVTEPVMWWLADASEDAVARFGRHLKEGRLGISGLAFNGTPLSDVATMSAQLANKRVIEERFGISIRTANIHDVNGIPWTMVDLLLDAGIELLTMAVNLHLGGVVEGRPGVFLWEGPSGRTIRVMNGAHYTMFDQLLYSWEDSIPRMEEGWAAYRARLESLGYPHDFCYLTTTCSPQLWDNAPANPFVAELIKEWNQGDAHPPIRYITPADLLERIKRIPAGLTPVRRGDWTDFWVFGIGARAHEAKLCREARRYLSTAQRINAMATRNPSARHARHRDEAMENVVLYEEHTCSHYITEPANEMARILDGIKSSFAYQAHSLAFLAMIEELDELALNEACASRLQSVAFYNPSGVEQEIQVRIPAAWRKEGRFFRANRFQAENILNGVGGDWCGPVRIAPYSHQRVAMDALTPAEKHPDLHHSVIERDLSRKSLNADFENALQFKGSARIHRIETPWYRLEFDSGKGRVLSLVDLRRDWEVFADGAEGFFDYVRERPDGLIDETRSAFFKRNLDREKMDQDNWQDWHAIRERATAVTRVEVEERVDEIRLITGFEAPGVRDLTRTIIVRANSPMIGIEVSMEKLAHAGPEAVYFTIPLRMASGWDCHFDTAGVPVALDRDQLPGSCRNWMCVDNYLSIHREGRGATLFCPDAPLVMAGDFHFGRPLAQVPRAANPKLVAWPMNNYWDTNFSRVQPGHTSFRYEFMCHGSHDAVELARHAERINHPVVWLPSAAMACESETLLRCDCDSVRILDICRDRFSEALILRLLNVSGEPVSATLEFKHAVARVERCSVQGQSLGDGARLIQANPFRVDLKPLELVHFKVEMSSS